MVRRVSLFLIAVLACNSKDDAPTPEKIARDGTDGAVVVVEGTVHALTYDSTARGGDFDLVSPGDRFLLIRTVVPAGVKVTDTVRADRPAAWGLGVRIPEGKLAMAQLPQLGDRVRVKGTLRHSLWNDTMLPIVEDATIEDLTSHPPLAMEGEACANDMACHERLLCDRATKRCVASTILDWGAPERNVNGACSADADCPLNQHCDQRYLVSATGPYGAPYYAERDSGKGLCVVDESETLASLCPRTYGVGDLVGGRLVSGKEVCVEATVWLPVQADDRDTHLQLVVPEPIPYPAPDIPYYVFGEATEIVPPYKDPARPQGTLADPVKDDHIVVLGTVRWDDSHGWWEVHPVKWIATLPAAGKTMAYPGRPEKLDAEALEEDR